MKNIYAKVIDCVGMKCPESILFLKQAVKQSKSGDVLLYKNDQNAVVETRINQYGSTLGTLNDLSDGEVPCFYKKVAPDSYELEVA